MYKCVFKKKLLHKKWAVAVKFVGLRGDRQQHPEWGYNYTVNLINLNRIIGNLLLAQ